MTDARIKNITAFPTSDETQQAKWVPFELVPVVQGQNLHPNLNWVQFVRHFLVALDRLVQFYLPLVVFVGAVVVLALYPRHYRILNFSNKRSSYFSTKKRNKRFSNLGYIPLVVRRGQCLPWASSEVVMAAQLAYFDIYLNYFIFLNKKMISS